MAENHQAAYKTPDERTLDLAFVGTWMLRIAAEIEANCPCGHCAAAAGRIRREAARGKLP